MSGKDKGNTIDVPVDDSNQVAEPDAKTKAKFINDLACICDVDPAMSKQMLITHKWDIQKAIDEFLEAEDSEEGESDGDKSADVDSSVEMIEQENELEDDGMEIQNTNMHTSPGRSSSPLASSSSEEPTAVADSPVTGEPGSLIGDNEIEINTATDTPLTPGGTNFSTWAPEKFSILSWNVDGLDEKNLEKRMAAVVDLIKTEQHGVVFLQELLPHTFEYIARRLCVDYFPVIGTDNHNSEYFTATFLRLHQVNYEDHFIVPYPGSTMDRKLLVTKAFIGRAKLALLNTHLESTADFAKERTSQLKQCFQLAETFPKEYNVIFGGDLNLRDQEVTGNLPQDMSDLWIKCGSRSTCQYTWDLTRNTNKRMPSKFQPRCRFDRLYYRDSIPKTLTPEFFGVTGIEKVRGTQSFPSDHWGIVSFFRLETEARKPAGKKRKAESPA